MGWVYSVKLLFCQGSGKSIDEAHISFCLNPCPVQALHWCSLAILHGDQLFN